MKTQISGYELKELLENEPDTKLKKKLLDMFEPTESEQEVFAQHCQKVIDLLTKTLGKRSTKLNPTIERLSWSDISFPAGKYRVGFDISMEYQDQQHLVVKRKSGEYSKVEIRVDPNNPQAAIDLVKVVLESLNHELEK